MAEPTVNRRRWLRYSMRTMLVVVTVLCALLAVVVNRAGRQRQAVEKLRESKGRTTVRYDYQQEGPSALRGPEWLRQWLGKDYFQNVVGVELFLYGDSEVTPDDLANLPGIKNLGIWQMPLTDDGLRTLARLEKLERLRIGSDEITDRGFVHLSRLSRLSHLSVSSNEITGAGLQWLAAQEKLRALVLRSDNLSRHGLEAVAQLPNLVALQLSSNSVTDVDLESLAKLKGLTQLTIAETKYQGDSPPGITDEGLKHIARLTNLQQLVVSSHGITDEGLAHLATLPNLTRLNVVHGWPMYTEEGVAYLQEHLPDLQVKHSAWKPLRGQPVGMTFVATPMNRRKSN